jgi:hypothetical protein
MAADRRFGLGWNKGFVAGKEPPQTIPIVASGVVRSLY